ncbi:MAG: 50S ribosomal protein L13 [Ignavibacteriales bacterium]|nr:50S ribosomal protein L13 [Ignavibacteriales bacterium]
MKQEKLTKSVKTEDANHKWFLVDAEGQVLGRLASKIAMIIRGKNKPIFTTNTDTGDFVVVINAEKVKLTGKRENLKEYKRHSGYPGGQTTTSFHEMIAKKPTFVVENAVRGMLPKTKLGNQLIKKLKVYAGTNHPHAAQQPEAISLMEK